MCTSSTPERQKKHQKPAVFNSFDFKMCFAPQWRALFRHLNVKKWSVPLSFLNFWLAIDVFLCFFCGGMVWKGTKNLHIPKTCSVPHILLSPRNQLEMTLGLDNWRRMRKAEARVMATAQHSLETNWPTGWLTDHRTNQPTKSLPTGDGLKLGTPTYLRFASMGPIDI